MKVIERRGVLGICVALFCAPSLQADPPGSRPPDQDQTAQLTLRLPEEGSFLLRGTLPVPRGTVVEGKGLTPLSILAPDGTALPTQVEVVSRYPARTDGADVVEVIARVERPAGRTPGERVSYAVAPRAQTEGSPQLHRAVAELLAAEGGLVLHSADVWGHRYAADLGAALRDPSEYGVRREGSLVRELAVHRLVLPEHPVGGERGTLPHMMGVHAWLTTYDREGFVTLDLHVHNGLHGLDPDDPRDDLLDRLYFDRLSLALPPGWRVLHTFEHPAIGATVAAGGFEEHSLLKPRGKSLYLMPRQSRFIRRLAIALPRWEERARSCLDGHWLGFCEAGFAPSGGPLWSWWNRSTARYFPQRHRLPTLDHLGLESLRDDLAAELAKRENQIAAGAAGTYPLLSPGLGWAHPWGVGYQGMTGGDEINPWDGVCTAAAASREGYRLAQLVARAYADRQPTALYAAGGRHTQVEDILVNGPNGPYAFAEFFIRPGPTWGFADAPDSQSKAAVRLGRHPRWANLLLGFMPIDLQHYVRWTRNLKVLAWLGNDSLSRHLLIASAEVFHLSFHRYPVGAWGWVPGTGLLARQKLVAADPGQGVDLGRGEAWGLDAAAAAYSLADDRWRERALPWFEAIAEVFVRGQSTCTGNIQATHIHKVLGGRFRVRRANESGFLDHALVGTIESVFRGRDERRARELDRVIVGSVRAGTRRPFWSEGHTAVWVTVGVSPADPTFDEYCTRTPPSAFEEYLTTEHSWSSLAYAWERTGDRYFLERAAQLAGGNLWTTLHEQGLKELEDRAAMLALIQVLGDQ